MSKHRSKALWVVVAILLVAGLVTASCLSWPNANRLSGYAARGDVSGIEWCLRLGVDPNEPSRWGWRHEELGPTPLTSAARAGHVAAIRLLIENGADPNLRDFGGRHATPLATAAMQGQLEACRALLECGADPNVPTYPEKPGDPGGWTALDWALQAQQGDVVDLLRRHGGKEGKRRD